MENDQAKRYLITAAYYLSFIAMGISMASLGPTLPSLAKNTGAAIGSIGVLFTARSLGSFIGSVWAGRLYDRVRGHGVMGAVIVLLAVAMAVTAYIPLLWVLTGVLFITGAAQGVLNIGANTLLVWVHDKKVGPFMNGLHFFFGIGTFFTPILIARMIVAGGGLEWTYLLLAVIILPAASVAFLPSPVPLHIARKTSPSQLDWRLIVLISLVFGCYNGAALAFGGWIYTYALEMKIADNVAAAYLTSVFWGGLTLGRLVAIPLARRFAPKRILLWDYCGAIVSILVLLFFPRSFVAVVISSAGLGFSLASIYPTTMSLSGQLMTLSGKITGLFSIGQSAGAMILPWVIGQFFETGGPQVLSVTLLADFLLAIGVLVLLGRYTINHHAND